MARVVVDPGGETWRVGRQWTPWRPRLRGSGDGDGASWAGEGLGGFDDAGGLLAGILLAVLMLLLFLVVWPLIAVALEVLLLLGALVAVAGRVVLRRPWTVRAVSSAGRVRRWKVVGWGPSGELIDEIGASIEGGLALPPGGEGHGVPRPAAPLT